MPDPGCTYEKPARCPDINRVNLQSLLVCKEDYTKCQAASGCGDPVFPYKCLTGQCVDHMTKCSEYLQFKHDKDPKQTKIIETNACSYDSSGKNASQDKYLERCADGVCRWRGMCGCVPNSG